MIPGPRPSDGPACPTPGAEEPEAVVPPSDEPPVGEDLPPVALTRSPGGWVVRSVAGSDAVGDLVEGMSLADLIAEEFGGLPEPGRSARRSARGNGPCDTGSAASPADPAAARIAALERTVVQLEHALAARVATERAIGVLAERQALSARAAFEILRHDARRQGRPVAELAREVLDALPADCPAAPAPAVPVVIAADGRS